MAEENKSPQLKALCPIRVPIDKSILDAMEAHWRAWARDSLTNEDKALWSADVHLMLWPHSKMAARNHFLGSNDMNTVSWVHLTMGKVMFGAEFLKTRTAASAQAKWPHTDLAEWRPNFNGITKHPAFLANPFVQETLVRLEGVELCNSRPWRQDNGPPPKESILSRQIAFASGSDSSKNNNSNNRNNSASAAASAPTAAASSESGMMDIINDMKKNIGDLQGLVNTQRQEYQEVKAANEKEISWLCRQIQNAADDSQKAMELMRKAHEREISELRGVVEAIVGSKQAAQEVGEYEERGFVLVNDE